MAIEQDIVNWLERQSVNLNIEHVAGRKAFLFQAGLAELHGKIAFEGAVGEFCRNLVRQCMHHGTMDDGRDAMTALLETAKTQVGQDRQQACDVLLVRWTNRHSRMILSNHTNHSNRKTPRTSNRGTQHDQVFICHAKEDEALVTQLYADLKQAGANPWIACKDILPGERWKQAIKKAMKQSSYFIMILSEQSVSKTGYVQKELKEALDWLDHMPSSKIFLIPVRIDPCKPEDERLQEIHWVDLFPFEEKYYDGLERILKVIRLRREVSPAPEQAPLQLSSGPEHQTSGHQPVQQTPPVHIQPTESSEPEHLKSSPPQTSPSGDGENIRPISQAIKNLLRGQTVKVLLIGMIGMFVIIGVLRRDAPIRLLIRSKPGTFSLNEIEEMVREKGFREYRWNPDGDFPNAFVRQTLNGDAVVIDRAAGLMWQQSGSSSRLSPKQAQQYIEELNQQKFAGYSDWRLPTIEELASLIEPKKQSNDLYLNPFFDKKQSGCWSADRRSGSGSPSVAWSVHFPNGNVGGYRPADTLYVRAVRFWH